MTNRFFLNAINRNMGRLNRYGECNLFISQHVDNEKEIATVIVRIPMKDKGGDYLSLRRLLTALKYRLDAQGDFDFEFTLKRRAKR